MIITFTLATAANTTQRQKVEHRTRRDRQQRQNDGFTAQADALLAAYMKWKADVQCLEDASPVLTTGAAATHTIFLFDIFRTYPSLVDRSQLKVWHCEGSYHFSVGFLPGDATRAAAFIRCGIIPSAPFRPAYGVTVRVLEAYRTTHLRCPHLGIEPYVKSLCDLHGGTYRPGFRKMFSTCYDIYLDLRSRAQQQINAELGRQDDLQWRRRNACPACTYRLEGEEKLIFDMLVTMDGNDSLKRVLRRQNIDGAPASQRGMDQEDSRVVIGDYYLTRDAVNKWANAALQSTMSAESSKDSEASPCEGRWQNMANEVTARMWGIFDETGVFLALCRHGFALVVADMVQSGEL